MSNILSLTYLITYLLTNSLTHLLNYLLTNSLTHSRTYLLTHLLTTYKLTYLLTCILTYLLTSWSRVFLEKLNVFQLVKKLLAFYGNWRFIAAFTSACHLSLSWARSIQSMPRLPFSWRSISKLFSHLILVLPSGPFPSGFLTKTLYTLLLSPCYIFRLPLSFRFDYPKNICWGLQIIKLLIRSFLLSPVTSSLLDPNILLREHPVYISIRRPPN